MSEELRGVDENDQPYVLRREGRRLLLEHRGETKELDRGAMRYELGRLRDALLIGATKLPIPRGRGSAARELIAKSAFDSAEPAEEEGALAARKASEQAWLASWLGENEELLAWVPTATELSVPSPLEDATSVEALLALTTERAALVAFGPLGDVRVESVEGEVVVDRGLTRTNVRVGDRKIESPLGRGEMLALTAPWIALPPASRARAVATHFRAKHPAVAAAHLRRAARRGDVLAELLLVWLGYGSVEEVVPRLPPEAFAELASLADAWTATPEERGALVDALVSEVEALANEHARAAALEVLEGRRRVRSKDDALDDDLRWMPRFVALGAGSLVREHLRAHLTELPAPQVLELVPQLGTDERPPMHAQRVALLEAIDTLTSEPESHDDARRELLQLSPFDASRAAVAFESPRLRARVEEVHALLAVGGLAPHEGGFVAPSVKQLERPVIDRHLRHPLTRDRSVVDRLQALIADVEVPDLAAIRSFARRLDHTPALDAVTDACVMLGTSGVEAFVSQGGKAHGLRVFEGKPSTLLFGAEHLPGGAHALDDGEVRFAIGAEIAHLAFDHARVSTSEVWAGAWQTGKATLSVALTLLPLAERFAHWGGRIATASGIGEAIGGVLPKKAKATTDHLGVEQEQLLAAHQLLQLSADRAGAVLAGDLRASVRALFLVTTTGRAELPTAVRLGLGELLRRRDASNAVAHPMLALRTAALIGFWVDDDHEAVAAALSA
ncbi:MAG: hypothetical protein H6721_00680 [Sandaracinus sp.]|nr:hypothetical protein [Sandaracinus sp.]